MDMFNLLVAGIPLILVVTGLVQFVKQKLELSGKGVEIFAYILGTVVGFGYYVYAAPIPITWGFNFIFEGLVFGLAIGLVATGIYDAYGKPTQSVG